MEMINSPTTKTNDINQLIRSRTSTSTTTTATTTSKARAMQSRQARPRRRAAANLWRESLSLPARRSSLGLVIILSCLGPSIIISCLVAARATAAAAAAASSSSSSSEVASAFDFSINSAASNGELPGGSRSLPYSSGNGNANNFDPSSYKNIHEAIRGHPDLREFASLCELDGVKEIVGMDRTPLTVFAPIDRSLGDLLAKSKSRSINLIELAKHHIAQGLVTADENTKYPLQFSDYGLLSPLYLNQQQQQQLGGASKTTTTNTFVNNAKILATHLIQIDSDNYQILHVIDQVIEFAYVSRKTQLASSGGGGGAGGGQLGSGGLSPSSQRPQPKITTTRKSKFSLDDLLLQANGEQQQSVLYDFYERFGDVASNQNELDVFHARAYRTGSASLARERLALSRDELNLERLGRAVRQHRQLRGKLYHANESQSYNTYFLPLNNDELDRLLLQQHDEPTKLAQLEALVIPDQVLFTRTMSLGFGHATLFDQHSQTHRVSLSLAKTMPQPAPAAADSAAAADDSAGADESRQLLSSPLLLQAKCQRIGTAAAPPSSGDGQQQQQQQLTCRPGVTSVELLVANIPLSNGVLHLIRRPILATDTNLLDYLNDNDNQLSSVLGASGSRTASGTVAINSQAAAAAAVAAPKMNRFRELLARERQTLASFSSGAGTNMTILAPSDEAFARLRYDLRALVLGDEQLIPHDWSASYRHDLLERLVKSHVILHESLTTDQLDLAGQLQVSTDNGRPLALIAERASSNEQPGEYLVDSGDSTRSRLIQHDLIGTNGVLHIIDRVLGEEQETVYSLLKSIVLRFNHSLAAAAAGDENGARLPQDLAQLIQSNIRNSQRQQQQQQQQQESTAISQQNSLDGAAGSSSSGSSNTEQQHKQPQKMDPELGAISRSIGQYLDELAAGNRRQLQLLASSVNISYQLARLTSLAEGLDDWNDKFRQPERMFTYFVPSDLAWIRLQQAQPELHKPLMYFLESGSSGSKAAAEGAESVAEPASNGVAAAATATAARSSESSHRLRQILERHLVVNKKIAGRDLNQLDSVKTMGATLRLVEAPSQSQLTATYSGDGSSLNQQPATSNFAALHSIFTGTSPATPGNQQPQASQLAPKLKSLKLDSASANIVQASEASNGYVYVIDNVLLLPEDSNYIVQTSQSPAMSSSMSSLLGGHNSVVFDFVHNLLSPAALNLSTGSILALMATLTVAIAVLLVIALVLVVRRRRQSKLNRHQQLESGLTSSSSANSGSTSTTKSL